MAQVLKLLKGGVSSYDSNIAYINQYRASETADPEVISRIDRLFLSGQELAINDGLTRNELAKLEKNLTERAVALIKSSLGEGAAMYDPNNSEIATRNSFGRFNKKAINILGNELENRSSKSSSEANTITIPTTNYYIYKGVNWKDYDLTSNEDSTMDRIKSIATQLNTSLSSLNDTEGKGYTLRGAEESKRGDYKLGQQKVQALLNDINAGTVSDVDAFKRLKEVVILTGIDDDGKSIFKQLFPLYYTEVKPAPTTALDLRANEQVNALLNDQVLPSNEELPQLGGTSETGNELPKEEEKFSWKWEDLSGIEIARLSSLGMDIAALGASFIPTYGTAAAAGLGLASFGTNLGADIADPNVTTGDIIKNGAINLGLSTLALIPGAGTLKTARAAGKTLQWILVNSAKLIPAATAAMEGVGLSSETIESIKKKGFENLSKEDVEKAIRACHLLVGATTSAKMMRTQNKAHITGEVRNQVNDKILKPELWKAIKSEAYSKGPEGASVKFKELTGKELSKADAESLFGTAEAAQRRVESENSLRFFKNFRANRRREKFSDPDDLNKILYYGENPIYKAALEGNVPRKLSNAGIENRKILKNVSKVEPTSPATPTSAVTPTVTGTKNVGGMAQPKNTTLLSIAEIKAILDSKNITPAKEPTRGWIRNGVLEYNHDGGKFERLEQFINTK